MEESGYRKEVAKLEDHWRSGGAPQSVDLVFDGPPGPEGGRFVEAEFSGSQRSLSAGRWVERPDGLWALRVSMVVPPEEPRG